MAQYSIQVGRTKQRIDCGPVDGRIKNVQMAKGVEKTEAAHKNKGKKAPKQGCESRHARP